MRLNSYMFIGLVLILTTLSSPGIVSSVAAQTLQPPQSADASPVQPVTQAAPRIQIPAGTKIEVEAPYTFKSMDFKPKDKISFRVVDPVKINGETLIEQGATATGRVEKSKRGGHWGKAGLLVWTMQTVTAIDGSQVPVQPASIRLRGDSKGAKVATQMIITGALMPLIAPVALLHGFKRGHDAFIPQGKRYSLIVSGDASVMLNATVSKKPETAESNK